MAQQPRRPRTGDGSQDEYVPPPTRSEPRDGFETPQPPEETETDDINPELLALKDELEKRLFARDDDTLKIYASGEALKGAENIVGLGIGPAMRDFESVGSKGPGAPVLNVYVAEPMTMDEAKAALVDEFGARALASDGEPVNVIRTGIIDTFAHRHRERRAPCGISIGHIRVTAGTLGVLARGRSGERVNRLLLVSNNHVIANSDAASVGDAII